MRKYLWIGACLVILGIKPVMASEPDKPKESYLKKANDDIAAWNEKLKSLQERSEKNGAKTRLTFDKQVKAIDEQLAIARKKLDALSNSSGENWKSFRRGVDDTLSEVKQNYHKAVSSFNKNDTREKS